MSRAVARPANGTSALQLALVFTPALLRQRHQRSEASEARDDEEQEAALAAAMAEGGSEVVDLVLSLTHTWSPLLLFQH